MILCPVTHRYNCCYHYLLDDYNYCKPRRAVKISAAAAPNNFGWLGGAPSVFRLAAAPDDSGWRRRRESAAEGSTTYGRSYGSSPSSASEIVKRFELLRFSSLLVRYRYFFELEYCYFCSAEK